MVFIAVLHLHISICTEETTYVGALEDCSTVAADPSRIATRHDSWPRDAPPCFVPAGSHLFASLCVRGIPPLRRCPSCPRDVPLRID
uniref:Uncharacterized protein n=1 Tax=Arundo donax TaxID=35708 RepID=A0A0A9MUF1_ARUDO